MVCEGLQPIGVLWQHAPAPGWQSRGSEGSHQGDPHPKVSRPQEALFAVDPGSNWQEMCAAPIGRLLENSPVSEEGSGHKLRS